MRSTNVQLID